MHCEKKNKLVLTILFNVMRVKETNLGGGVVRLEVVPTFRGERIPTHVVDRVMEDVVRNKSRVEMPNRHALSGLNSPHRPFGTHKCLTERHRAELAWRDTSREPDGIDIHVDRPRKENFWSHKAWAEAMAKYRTLEDVARDCDWECREPMKGTNACHKHACCCHNHLDDEFGCEDFDLESEVEDILHEVFGFSRNACVGDYLRFV